jgi:hypothetical protein
LLGAGHVSHYVGDTSRGLFQDSQIVAVDLHTDLRPNAGRQHVDAIDNRHRPDIRDPWQLNRLAHIGA